MSAQYFKCWKIIEIRIYKPNKDKINATLKSNGKDKPEYNGTKTRQNVKCYGGRKGRKY